MNSRAGKIIRGCVAGLFGIVVFVIGASSLSETAFECGCERTILAYMFGMFLGLFMLGIYNLPLLLVKIGKWLKKIITARRVI